MLRITFSRVRPDKVELLRAWMADLARREEEVLETFRQETVRHEVAYLLESGDGPVLVYAIEAADLAQAARAVETQPLPIDLEHRRVMREAFDGVVPTECLLDIRLEGGQP